MNFFELIKNRQSIRSFQAKQITKEMLDQLFNAINQAPSAGNLQAYEIFVTEEQSIKQDLAKAAWNQNFIIEAPIVLIFCINPKRSSSSYGIRGEELYCVQDAAIATTHAMLAATALGLASCWVGAFNDERVSKVLNLPKELKPTAILPIGYANEKPSATGRRKLTDLIKYCD